ncbi:MAG: ABC transporter permease, partial [Pseudomonadota bacterium]|nr:ABC transporter permease [Pseudomonadota bacterium]
MNARLLCGSIARRIARHKLKTFFMMLGVMLGVFVLTSGMSLAGGFRFAVLDYFDKTFLPDSITLATNYGVPDPSGIDEADVAALLTELPELTAWSPLVPGGRVDLERNGIVQRAGLSGTGPGAPATIGQDAVDGTYITDDDVRTRARVVLLGNT